MTDLIQQYVNLYRILWNGNSGLWTEDLERMSKRELRKEIREMKQAIKEDNSYYPGLGKKYQRETQYSKRVRELEAEGLNTSDAQAVADLEKLDDTIKIKAEKIN